MNGIVHTACSTLCLVSLTEQNVFGDHPSRCCPLLLIVEQFSLMCCILFIIHKLMGSWFDSRFGLYGHASMNNCIHDILWTCFHFSWVST